MHKICAYYSDRFLDDYDTVDCENPYRVADVYTRIKDIADFRQPPPCPFEDLTLCHSTRLIESVQSDAGLFEVARLAAGGAMAAAQASLEAPSFALVRPPGHHAGFDFNGGFCFFNNIALATRKLLATGAVRSALIVDIDLHYGNGTINIFRDEEAVQFANIQAFTREEFFAELERAIDGAQRFDVIGCSAGFDTYIKDWGQLLHTDDFNRIGYLLASSHPHLFSVLEGGYYVPDLGKNVRAYLEGILEACS
jgi:acetoin utilization deacetylase AcuC-like enzyme